MNKIDWVLKIAPLAVYCHKKYGYPTAALFAPCLETGYGERPLVKNANNIFGMKKTLLPYKSTVWNGETVWADTWEDVDGQAVQVKAEFRKYNSILDCMEDFCQFMTKTEKYGSHVIGKSTDEVLDYLTGRYATDEHYGEKIKRIIEENGLRKFDRPNIPEPPAIIDCIAKNASQVPAHSANSHEYLAIHYLGKEGENPDLYNNGYGGHFYISKDGKCYQAALVTDKIWHVGVKGTAYEYIHPEARNANTIGIECATYTKDGKWYFTEATQRAAAQLAAWLMFCLDIPADHLLRHGDITTKHCPKPYMDFEGQGENWTWDRFKTEVKMAKKEYVGLVPGSKGERVLWWKRGLLALGFADCAYYLDGFGDDDTYDDRTVDFTRRFQAYYGLTVDGCAGSQSQPIMERELARINLTEFNFTAEELITNGIKVGEKYKKGGYVWGSADIAPWLQPDVNKSSCDRGLDETFHGLLELGNREARGIYTRLIELGAKELPPTSEIQAGDIIILTNWHIFLAASAKNATGSYTRIDFGSSDRMQRGQPFVEPIANVKTIVRPLYKKKPAPAPKRRYTATIEQVTVAMQGASVRLLQVILTGLGYYKGDIDGYFGTLTEAALNAFQAYWIANGVDIGTNGKPDSICGRGCWEKLLGVAVKGEGAI